MAAMKSQASRPHTGGCDAGRYCEKLRHAERSEGVEVKTVELAVEDVKRWNILELKDSIYETCCNRK